jgi:dTDP-4-dehydrorhamnose reductase
MAILVTGAGGQVGSELQRRAGVRPLMALTHAALDITDAAAVAAALRQHQARLVINAAGWTDVDGAEQSPQAAFAANAEGPAVLAAACGAAGIPLVHLSTDHVFDGQSRRPWRESDPVAPVGVYGRSKLAGEAAIRERLGAHLILRSSWLFGARGGNFLTTVLRWAREQKTLRVVANHVGGPTPVAALAETLLQLADRHLAGEILPWGTYHYCGSPCVSRYAFADAVLAEAHAGGLLSWRPILQAISVREWPGAPLRPANACLDCSEASLRLGLQAPAWRPALREALAELKELAAQQEGQA